MDNENLSIDNSVPSEETTSEQMVPQSQVNKIVMREAEKAALKARKDVEAQYQQQIESLNVSQQQRNNEVSKNVDADALYQQIQERMNSEMQRRQQEAHIHEVANNFLSKMEQGRQTYGQDFESAMQDFDAAAFPQLVYLVSGLDGAADVMMDLAKNPLKLAAIDRLAEKNWKQAHSELVKLAASINANKQAEIDAQNQGTLAPLDHLQPTRNAGSNGKPSISDLRNQPWLRG